MGNFLKKDLKSKDGIFLLPILDSETQKVVKFYKATPFPNYKDDEDKQTLLEKGNKNILAKEFKKFVGYNKKVLEV